ncbi:MAG: hypothetical protein RR795_03485 [Cetobacterium sp.]
MKKICLTCNHAKYHDSMHMLCIEDIKFCSPLVVEQNFHCKDYNKLSNKGIIKRLAEIHGVESHKYCECEGFIYEIEFDKDEGFQISTPIVINGVRKNKNYEIYYDQYDANFLVNKLDELLEDKE